MYKFFTGFWQVWWLLISEEPITLPKNRQRSGGQKKVFIMRSMYETYADGHGWTCQTVTQCFVQLFRSIQACSRANEWKLCYINTPKEYPHNINSHFITNKKTSGKILPYRFTSLAEACLVTQCFSSKDFFSNIPIVVSHSKSCTPALCQICFVFSYPM